MNNKTHYLSAFYFLGCGVRDTLEYFIKRPEYSIQAFNAKKSLIEIGLREDHPFANFCKQQGELGEKIHKQLVDLYNLAYNEEKRTFLHVSGTQIEVDLNQGIKVLDLIIPLKTTLASVCASLIASFDEDEKNEVKDVVNLENEFYSDIAGLVIFNFAFLDRFKKFNEEMKAHNGQESVESNFTVSELSKLVSIFNYVKQQTRDVYESFNNIAKVFEQGVNLSNGKVQAKEGSDIFKDLNELHNQIGQLANPVEVKFHAAHDAFFKIAFEFEKEMQAKMAEASAESKN